MKIYLAASFDHRQDMLTAVDNLRERGFEVFSPVEHIIPHAWDYPNHEWGQMVFTNDVEAINTCDIMVMLCYGRNSSAGANWEAGYAFGIGKKVIVVEMTNDLMSLMVANGRYATVKGLDGLSKYNFNELPKTRTLTEQK